MYNVIGCSVEKFISISTVFTYWLYGGFYSVSITWMDQIDHPQATYIVALHVQIEYSALLYVLLLLTATLYMYIYTYMILCPHLVDE